MRKPLFAGALAALLATPLACDLQKTGNQLTAKNVLVATLLSTPKITMDPRAMAGLDGGFDAGAFAADSGYSFDAGTLTIPPQTAAYVFFGKRTSDSLDVPPEAEPNAELTVTPAGGATVALKNDGAGNYSKTSIEDSTFKYEQGKTYDFTAVAGGVTYVGAVENAPALESITLAQVDGVKTDFHPAKGWIDLAAGTALSFTRPDPPSGQERNLGFVNVFPISDQGNKGEPTYTNVPTTPLGFLKLVALPLEWKSTEVTIPGTAFPEAKKTYVVVFQSVKLGGPKSDNLFTGSAILAGTADVTVVRTK